MTVKVGVEWSRMGYSPTGMAAWSPTSRTCGFPLCILVLSEELKPRSLLKKKNKTPISNMPLGLFYLISPWGEWGGGGLIEDFSTWQKTSVRLKFNNEMLVKYWIIFLVSRYFGNYRLIVHWLLVKQRSVCRSWNVFCATLALIAERYLILSLLTFFLYR